MFYGSKLIYRGLSVLDLFDEGRNAGVDGRSMAGRVAGTEGKGNMKEVEVVPLCAACCVGTEGEDVVQKGLKRVERVDGGLGRARWGAGESRAGLLRRAPAVSCLSMTRGLMLTLHQSIRSLSPDSSLFRRIGDGSHDESRGYLATPPGDSTIYVSINDPIGQPAFKPSPTKPIPIWMQPFRGTDHQTNYAGPLRLAAANTTQVSFDLDAVRDPTGTASLVGQQRAPQAAVLSICVPPREVGHDDVVRLCHSARDALRAADAVQYPTAAAAAAATARAAAEPTGSCSCPTASRHASNAPASVVRVPGAVQSHPVPVAATTNHTASHVSVQSAQSCQGQLGGVEEYSSCD